MGGSPCKLASSWPKCELGKSASAFSDSFGAVGGLRGWFLERTAVERRRCARALAGEPDASASEMLCSGSELLGESLIIGEASASHAQRGSRSHGRRR